MQENKKDSRKDNSPEQEKKETIEELLAEAEEDLSTETGTGTGKANGTGSGKDTDKSSAAGFAGRKHSRGRKRPGRGMIRLLCTAALIVLTALAVVLIVKNTPTNRRMSDEEYFGSMQEDEAAIILGDQMIPERAIVKDGALYLPYDIVQNTLNGRFYWDADIAKMLFTTATREFEIPVNSTSYSVIDGVTTSDPVSEGTYDRVIVLRPDDNRITGTGTDEDAGAGQAVSGADADSGAGLQDAAEGAAGAASRPEGNTTGLYVSADFLQLYTQVEYTWTKAKDNGGHVLIRYEFGSVKTAKAVKEAAVRFQGGIKSPILTDLAKGDSAVVLEQSGRWSKVLTKDGYIGYAKSGRLSEVTDTELTCDIEEQQYPSLTSADRISLVWHQVMTRDANDGLKDSISAMTGVNVISPTWFSLSDNDGNITSLGTKKYVKTAHGKGLKVWGLVSDFSSEMDTSAVLASTAARRNCIGQLVDEALHLGLDGINLDFEYMEEADALAYVQFVRELSIECRLNELVFSVDIKPPYDFNFWMDRKELGTVADYLINMGYDEHYDGSEPGSVASLPYESEAIEETIAQGVPAEKLISAIPFYTRIWYSSEGSDGSVSTSSEILTMAGAAETLKSWNLTPSWDEETSQHYAEWTTDDGVTCRIWLEDADSIAEKARLVPVYGLGGIAAWKLGLETSDVWSAISDNLNLTADEAKAAGQQAESEHAQEIRTGEETETEQSAS